MPYLRIVVKLEGSLGDLSGFCLLTAMLLDLREATPTLRPSRERRSQHNLKTDWALRGGVNYQGGVAEGERIGVDGRGLKGAAGLRGWIRPERAGLGRREWRPWGGAWEERWV